MRKNTRILLIATTLLTMMSCGKEIDENKGQESGSFVKGQQVSITCTNLHTKATGTDSEGGYAFTWSKGDEILVSIGTASSVFTLSSGASSATATFTGQMPSSGSTFSVQWPKATPTLDGGTQTYVAGGIDASMVYAKADNCSLGSTISLAPQYSVLRIGLWDDEKTVGKIVVTNMTASPNETYTLDCGDGIELKNTRETAKYFSIIVPQGEYEFSVTAYDNSATPEFFYYTATNSKIKFEAASVKKMALPPAYPEYVNKMPSAVKGQWWAPVNCGYDATNYTYGLLYQWGRKCGCGYNDGSAYKEILIQTNSTTTSPISASEEKENIFYLSFDEPNDWLTPKDDDRWDCSGNSASTSSVNPVKSSYDPCPAGWRVPTYAELNALLGGNNDNTSQTGFHGNTTGLQGKFLNGSSSASVGVFLPSAGFRSGDHIENAHGRGILCFYWSSSVNSTQKAQYLYFVQNSKPVMWTDNRADGGSVRCVYDGEVSDTGDITLPNMTNDEQTW